MERKNIYENLNQKSLFSFLKNSQFQKLHLKIPASITQDNYLSNEIQKMEEKLNELRAKVIYDNSNLSELLKEIEFYISTGNNNKILSQLFFSTKSFLQIIECLNFAHETHLRKFLNFIEKMLNNKSISRYLVKKKEFIKKIFTLMYADNLFEICIRICEEIFINSEDLIPIGEYWTEIEKVYKKVKNEKLNIFCRILAIMIFDYKKMEFKQIFKYKENLKLRPYPKATTENQSICFNLPDFLPSLIQSFKNKVNQTMRVCNQIPLINSLIAQSSNTATNWGSNSNPFTNSSTSPNKISIISNRKQNFSFVNSRYVTLNCFNSFKSEDIESILFSDIFSNFVPDWNELKSRERDNIYNTYMKFTKIVKVIPNKSKVKDNYNKNILNILKNTTCQIEMLFVMSTLVGCKRKNEIQDKLAKENIIEVMDNYLEYLEWGNIFNESNRPIFNSAEIDLHDDSSYHGQGCNCDSDHAIRIQYLRFIYTYCCRDNINLENKLKLISKFDIENVFCPSYLNLFYFYFLKNHLKYKDNPGVKMNKTFTKLLELAEEHLNYKSLIDLLTQNGANSTKNENDSNIFFSSNSFDVMKEINLSIQKIIYECCNLDNVQKLIDLYSFRHEQVGLLYKLIIKYIQECHYSSSKFWLASCIEVMVRGNNNFIQFYIGTCSGLMPCLLYDILYPKTEQTQILQFSFDILGELIKFNKANFLMLNYYFVDQNEFSVFVGKIVKKTTLVDSNVFLRSIIISINYFDEEDKKLKLSREKNEFFTQNCKFCGFIQKSYRDIFYSLINIIKPNDINQTNISCINSALLILILKYFRGELGIFLNVKYEFYNIYRR